MANDTSRRRKFYDQMSESYDLGSFEEFDKKMNDAASRKRLHDFIDKDGKYDIGTFEYFDKAMRPSDDHPYKGMTVNTPDGVTFTEGALDSMALGATPVVTGTQNSNEPPVQKEQRDFSQPVDLTRPQEYQIPMPFKEGAEQARRLSGYPGLNRYWNDRQREAVRRLLNPQDTASNFEYRMEGLRESSEADAARRMNRGEFDKQHFEDFYQQHVASTFGEERASGEEKAREEVRRRLAGEIFGNTAGSPTGVLPDGYDTFQTSVAVERETDPAKIAARTLQRVQNDKAFGDYVLSRMGINGQSAGTDDSESEPLTEDEKKYMQLLFARENGEVADQVIQRIYDQYKAEGAPKSTLDYIAGKAFRENFAASLLNAMIRRAAESSGIREQLRAMASEEYGEQAGWLTRMVGGAAPFAVDIVTGGFAAPAAVGQAIVKGGVGLAAKQVTKEMSKRAASRGLKDTALEEAVAGSTGIAERYLATQAPILNLALRTAGSAANFATYDVQSEAVRQLAEGEFNAGNLVRQAIHGATLGGILGVTGGMIANATRNSGITKKVLADIASVGAETGIFAAANGIEKAREEGIDITDVDWADTTGEALGMVVGMKVGSAAVHPRTLLSRYRHSQDLGMQMTQRDIDELKSAGYDFDGIFKGLGKFGEVVPQSGTVRRPAAEYVIDAEGKRTQRNTETEEAYVDADVFNSVLSSPEISSSVKRKLTYIATGKVLSLEPVFGVSMDVDENGKATITTKNAYGNPIETKEYKSEEDASQEYQALQEVARTNTIGGLERIAEQAGFQDVRDIAKSRTSEETGIDVDNIEQLSELDKEQANSVLDAYVKNLQDAYMERFNENLERIGIAPAAETNGEAGVVVQQRTERRQSAYDRGVSAADDETQLPAVGYDRKLAEARMTQAMPDSDQRLSRIREQVTAAIENGDIETAERILQQQSSNLSDQQRDVVESYIDSYITGMGVSDAIQRQVENYEQQTRAAVAGQSDAQGIITPLQLRDGSTVYYQSGDLDGFHSSIMVVTEDGETKQISSKDILQVMHSVSIEDAVYGAVQAYSDQLRQRYEGLLNGNMLYDGQEADIVYANQPFHVTALGQDAAGNTVVRLEDGSRIAMTPEQLAEAIDAADRLKIQQQFAEEQAAVEFQQRTERFNSGIAGYREGTPDLTAKETKPDVAAEYLLSQTSLEGEAVDRKKVLADIQVQASGLDNEIQQRMQALEQERNNMAMAEGEEADVLRQHTEQLESEIEELRGQRRKWGEIRQAMMNNEEREAFERDRIKAVNGAKTQSKKEVMPAADAAGAVAIPTAMELADKYPERSDGESFVDVQRRQLSQQYRNDVYPTWDNIQKRLDDYQHGLTDMTPDELRTLTDEHARLESLMAQMVEQQNAWKKLGKDLGKEYSKRERQQMTPHELAVSRLQNEQDKGKKIRLAQEAFKDDPDALAALENREPQDIYEYVAANLGAGSINWEGMERGEHHVRGLQEELGKDKTRGVGAKYDTNAFNYFLAPTGQGKGIEEVAHDIAEGSPYDVQDVKDVIISMLGQTTKPTDVSHYIENARIAEAERIYEENRLRERDAELEAENEAIRQMTGMDPEEYDSYISSLEQRLAEQEGYMNSEEYFNNIVEYERAREERSIGGGSETGALGVQGQESDKTGASTDVEGGTGEADAVDVAPIEKERRPVTRDKISAKDKNLAGNLEENFHGTSGTAESGGIEKSNIQGLEDYSEDEIKEIVRNYVENQVADLGVDAEIVDMKIIGSRTTGTAKSDSDLDVLVEYNGNEREDDFFNLLADADEPLFINGIKVDINPITRGKSGTIAEYLERNKDYDTLKEKRNMPFADRLAAAKGETNLQPTEDQKRAGNYKMGHVSFGGYRMSIENPKGSVRNGVDQSGRPWSITMQDTYGYIGKKYGTDGDHLDFFVNDDADLDTWNGRVYVVDQKNSDGAFDEHKVMYGYPTWSAAKKAYERNYESGWWDSHVLQMTGMKKEDFDKWLSDSNHKTKPFADYSRTRASDTVSDPIEQLLADVEDRKDAASNTDASAPVVEPSYKAGELESKTADELRQLRKKEKQNLSTSRVILGTTNVRSGSLKERTLKQNIAQAEANIAAIDSEIERKDSETRHRIEQQEIGGAMVDQLEGMGFDVSTDQREMRKVRKQAKRDNSEEGKMRHFETPDGQIYGFVYRGKMYLDPRKIDAELPIHEYAHPWCEAFRRLNPGGWKNIVGLMKDDEATWNFVKQLNSDLGSDDDIAEEMIAKFSGQRGQERAQAEYERMNSRDPDYKSKWGNIWKNISKAIQDFWKQVGDFLHIKYESAEQVYDQVVRDFANKINPRKRVEQWLKERDNAYMNAVERGDAAKAKELFDEALRENIGNGITPFLAVDGYRGKLQKLAHGMKSRDPKVIAQVADLMAPLIPKDAVLVPAPSHTGKATDMLDLAKAISERTGVPVADVLTSKERASQYESKKAGRTLSSDELGIIAATEQLPAGKLPVVIDNVVDSGNTAEACVRALGKGIVASLADSADRYKHVASLKSAEPVVIGRDGNVVPLSKRFVMSSKYLDKAAETSAEETPGMTVAEDGVSDYHVGDKLKIVDDYGVTSQIEITEIRPNGDIVVGSDEYGNLTIEAGELASYHPEKIQTEKDANTRLQSQREQQKAKIVGLSGVNKYGLDEHTVAGREITAFKDQYPNTVVLEYNTADGTFVARGNDAMRIKKLVKGTLSQEAGVATLTFPESEFDLLTPRGVKQGMKFAVLEDVSKRTKSTPERTGLVKITPVSRHPKVKSIVEGLLPFADAEDTPQRTKGADAVPVEIGGKAVDLKKMSDEELLEAMSTNTLKDRDFFVEEYDRRHREEYGQAVDQYTEMLERDSTTLEDAYDMYAGVSKAWNEGGFKRAERTSLMAQIDALEDYVERLEAEQHDRELEEEFGGDGERTEALPLSTRQGESGQGGKRAEAYEQQKSKVRAHGYDLTRLKMRELSESESCHVERRYEENKSFSFTGGERVESAADVAYIFRQLEDSAVENSFMVLIKDGTPTVVHLAIGAYNGVPAPIEQAFVAAQAIDPDQVIFLHNHPSGNLVASRQDNELQKKVEELFPGKAQPGIIIDTKSGKFAQFSAGSESVASSRPQKVEGDEIPVKVFNFSKQVFDKDWNPETAFKGTGPTNIAAFVSSHRLGEHQKMSLLVMDMAGHITGNVFLPWTRIDEAAKAENAQQIATYINQMGGIRCVIYGNYDAGTGQNGDHTNKAIKDLQEHLRQRNVYLTDALNIERSARDWGVLEPDVARETDMAHDPGTAPIAVRDTDSLLQEVERRKDIADKKAADDIVKTYLASKPRGTFQEQARQRATKAVLKAMDNAGVPYKVVSKEEEKQMLKLFSSLNQESIKQMARQIRDDMRTQKALYQRLGTFNSHTANGQYIIYNMNDPFGLPMFFEKQSTARWGLTSMKQLVPEGDWAVIDIGEPGATAVQDEQAKKAADLQAMATLEDGRTIQFMVGGEADVIRQRTEQPIFISNALQAVEGIKQEKGTAEQWLAMIQKNGGLKAGEDKWLGLSDWLKEQASRKRSLTRKEVLDYIRRNQIQVEEQHYTRTERTEKDTDYDSLSVDSLPEPMREPMRALNERFATLFSDAMKDASSPAQARNAAFVTLREEYGSDFIAVFASRSANELVVRNPDYLQRAAKLLGVEDKIDKPINSTRLRYTTHRLENKREIALTVPTIEPWNEHDEIHFGDAGGGRAVAWIRFGETDSYDPVAAEELKAAEQELYDYLDRMSDKYETNPDNPESLERRITPEEKAVHERILANIRKKETLYDATKKRTLVIDEIQSKRHQEGRELGYQGDFANSPKKQYEVAYDQLMEYKQELDEKYGEYHVSDQLTDEERAKYDEMYQKLVALSEVKDDKTYTIPDAPFEKNWHELAMKRMLRYAAENGYDKMAWTTGEQQAVRYNIGNVVEKIISYDYPEAADPDGRKSRKIELRLKGGETMTMRVGENGKVIEGRSDTEGKMLSDIVGKELAKRIMGGEGKDGTIWDFARDFPAKIIEGVGLRIGGEGMKGFYDEILPRFMNKYGKKWGIKVDKREVPVIGQTMWAVDVTPEMKESVLHGQPMFQKEGKRILGWTDGKQVFLTAAGLNPNTPIHETTHMWDKWCQKEHPELWKKLVHAMKQTTMWEELSKNPDYRNIWADDDRMASEVHSRLSGATGEEEFVKAAFKKDTPQGIINEVKSVLKKFWEAVLRLFNKHTKTIADDFDSLASIVRMPIRDLVNKDFEKVLRVAEKEAAGQVEGHIETSEVAKRDKEYADAVAAGDMEKVDAMLREEAKMKGYSEDSSYQGTTAFNGTAPSKNAYFDTKEARKKAYDDGEYDGTASLGDFMDSGIDLGNLDWTIHDWRGFRTATSAGKESIMNLRNAVDGKKKTITMYRSVPSSVKENSFRSGDWITPSKQYAKDNALVHGWGRKYRIIEQEVSVDDVWWDNNDINEWGYDDGKNYAYRNAKNNRKLLEPTYDEDGNLIPLSQRFNEKEYDVMRSNGKKRQVPSMESLKNAENFISESLKGNKAGKVFTIELPTATLRQVRAKMGRDYDSHNIAADGIRHANKNHGVGGEKLQANSIPLREEDFVLAPYIMTKPDWVERGSYDQYGRESVKFFKRLSNGYVVVVEKEEKISPDDMDTINMWAELSEAVNDRNPRRETSETAILSRSDAAKIRKDAETAIENDRKMREQQQISMKQAAERAGEQLGGTTVKAFTGEDIDGSDKDAAYEKLHSENEKGTMGMYDPNTGEVTLLLDNIEDVAEAVRTVFHEKLGHEGLVALLGSQAAVNKFGSFIFKSAGKTLRQRIMEKADDIDPEWKKGDRYSTAAQEVLADIAADGPRTGEEFDLWTKVKHYIIRFCNRMGWKIRGLLNDHDLRYYILKTGEALKRWNKMSDAERQDLSRQAGQHDILRSMGGRPRQKKGESMAQYFQRLREWEKWRVARQRARDNGDPEPKENTFHARAEADFKSDLQSWKARNGVAEGVTGVGVFPQRREDETPQEYAIRVAEHEAASDIWKTAPNLMDYLKKANENYRRAYTEWRERYDLDEQESVDQRLYEGNIDTEPTFTDAEMEAEALAERDLADALGMEIDEEGAKRLAKLAVIERRKDFESANAEDAIWVHDFVKRTDEVAAEIQQRTGRKVTGKEIREALPFLIEEGRRRENLEAERDEAIMAVNKSEAMQQGHTFIDMRNLAEISDELEALNAAWQHKQAEPGRDAERAYRDAAKMLADRLNELNEGMAGYNKLFADDIMQIRSLLNHASSSGQGDLLPESAKRFSGIPEIEQLKEHVKSWYDEFYQLLEDAGLRGDAGYIEDGYVNHVWDKEKSDPKAWDQYIENRQRTKSPNMRHREIDTYMDGIEIGLVPKYTDIADMMAHYSRQNNEAVANRRFLDDLQFVVVQEMNSEGEVTAVIPLLMTDKPDALLRERYAQYYVPGVGDVYVLKHVQRRFANIFGTMRTPDAAEWLSNIGNAYDLTSSTAKKIQLALSGFHALALFEVDVAQNNPAVALKHLFKYIIVDSIKSGTLPAYAHPEDFQLAAKHLVQLGATEDYAAADVNAITKKIREFFKGLQADDAAWKKAAGNVGSPAAIMMDWVNQGFDLVLWNYLHDGLKLCAFKELVKQVDRRVSKEGLDEDTRERLLDEAGQYVNDMFGGQYWELLNVSPATLKWMRRLFLSPDWLVSTQRHFLANFGIGSIYSDGGFREYVKYNTDNIQRLLGKDIPHNELRRLRSFNAKQCYLIGAMFWWQLFYNAINALCRWMDEDDEKKKAEEIRKTNPKYKSPYELAYPDGMKWYDYTMWGNAVGQQTHLFTGRYSDGTETYVRWGKQFREFPELFMGRHGAEFPAPLIQRMMSKANPNIGTMIDFLGAQNIGGFNGSYENKELREKYGKTIATLSAIARHFIPFGIPTQADKEYKWLDFFMPSSKGFSRWKAKDYFETFIMDGDWNGIEATYNACVMNGIDAEKTLDAAIASIKATQKRELKDGATDLSTATMLFDASERPEERAALLNKIKEYLKGSEYKAMTREEAIEKVHGFIDGTDVSEKENVRYMMLATSDDIIAEERLRDLGRKAKKFKEQIKAAESDEAYDEMMKRYGVWLTIDKMVGKTVRRINKSKKQLGALHEDSIMSSIRQDIRDTMEEINELQAP